MGDDVSARANGACRPDYNGPLEYALSADGAGAKSFCEGAPRQRTTVSVPHIWPIAATLLVLLLPGCASRPEVGALLANYQLSEGSKNHTILVATSRARDLRPGTYFSGERSPSLNYATLTVGVPPTHVPGQIEWPSRAPGDAMTDFVVRDAAYLESERAFVKALNAQLAMRSPGRRKVFVFIQVTIRCLQKDFIDSHRS